MQPNRILTIGSVPQLVRWWPFFREGLNTFRKEFDWDKTDEDFLKELLHIYAKGSEKSLMIVLVGGVSSTPLGFLVATDISTEFSPRTALVYALYSSNKVPSIVQELRAEGEQWARNEGFTSVQAVSFRDTGASKRWFQKNMGFRSRFVVFSKAL